MSAQSSNKRPSPEVAITSNKHMKLSAYDARHNVNIMREDESSIADGDERLDSVQNGITERDLAAMTHEERLRFYERSLAGHCHQLADIPNPQQTNFPIFSDEIFAAHSFHSRFAVKVWTNYDASNKRFFTDPRLNDCGKLHLRPAQSQLLRRIKVSLCKVRFELGTPFDTLYHINLTVKHPEPGSGKSSLLARYRRLHKGGHRRLDDLCEEVCERIEDHITLKVGSKGLMLSDIEVLASWFVRRRDPIGSSILRHPDWMDIDSSWDANDGWVDVEALRGGNGARAGD